MAFEEALLRASLVMDSSNPLSSRIPTTLRPRCWCWCCCCRVQVVLVKRWGREKGTWGEGGFKGKMKSLVEWDKKMALEAKLVAMVMIWGFGMSAVWSESSSSFCFGLQLHSAIYKKKEKKKKTNISSHSFFFSKQPLWFFRILGGVILFIDKYELVILVYNYQLF